MDPRRPRNGRYLFAVAVGYVPLTAPFACHQPTPARAPQSTKAPTSVVTESTTEASQDPEPVQERIVIPDEILDQDRWLWAEEARDGARGGWATGSFDPKRNKIDIETRDVERFAVDVSRIPINWERLVVIGINNINSELRRRDYSVLHFARDDHGRWVVLEP